MLTRRNLLKGAAAGVPIAMGSVARWPATALAQAGTKTFVLAPGQSFTFTVTTPTVLNAGTVFNVVTVSGRDDEGTAASANANATVTVTNATPSVVVNKFGRSSMPEGQTATFGFTISNTSSASTDPVTVTSVVDDVLGDLTAILMSLRNTSFRQELADRTGGLIDSKSGGELLSSVAAEFGRAVSDQDYLRSCSVALSLVFFGFALVVPFLSAAPSTMLRHKSSPAV